MPIKRLKEFLDTNNVKYIVVSHSRAFTAQETAKSAHIARKELAKTIMVKIDGKIAMAILPSSCNVDFELLKNVTNSSTIELANEKEFQNLFPDCEVGSMPPFGNLYNMEVFVAESLSEDEEFTFNAGTHRELIKMSYKDFERLVKPKVGKFSVEIK